MEEQLTELERQLKIYRTAKELGDKAASLKEHPGWRELSAWIEKSLDIKMRDLATNGAYDNDLGATARLRGEIRSLESVLGAVEQYVAAGITARQELETLERENKEEIERLNGRKK